MKVGDEQSYMKGTSCENDLQTANYPLFIDEWNGFWARNMSSAVSCESRCISGRRLERSNNRKTSAIEGDEWCLELAIALNNWRFKNNEINKTIEDRLASFGNCTPFL